MDIVIVGGGIVGVAAAARLGADGHAVTLFEKDELGAGTTATSAAVFSWQEPRPTRFDHDLRRRAWETYGPLVESGALGYERIGALSVADSGAVADDLRAAAGTLREFGLDARFLSPNELRERGVEPLDSRGGLYTPEEGYFGVDELVAHFARVARESGARIRTGEEVTGVRTDDGAVIGVETAADPVPADAVVNAAGPWATRLNDMAGASLPLRHTRGPILVVESSAPVEVPFALFESKLYVRPYGENRAFVGRYATDYADGETLSPDEPGGVDGGFRTDALDFVREAIPALADATVADEWVGIRTVTPDGRPIVGETGVEGYLVACGMSGLGVTLAPAVADLLAAGLGPESPPEALSRLSPARFSDADGAR
ncbi:NAD(P)/FAD-dependent oxidoreductase [Halegenticoccus soli]|uniref:NAD(P)/FAD-dependent oxidoreductase n=1 Tax=Halegenticoccus soli TaxID=1985678 RepID=UPI000C6DFC6D|nr:FAD-dependent oxidoreductase [Halegenticoccus soli]